MSMFRFLNPLAPYKNAIKSVKGSIVNTADLAQEARQAFRNMGPKPPDEITLEAKKISDDGERFEAIVRARKYDEATIAKVIETQRMHQTMYLVLQSLALPLAFGCWHLMGGVHGALNACMLLLAAAVFHIKQFQAGLYKAQLLHRRFFSLRGFFSTPDWCRMYLLPW
jgi:hypothetical protein